MGWFGAPSREKGRRRQVCVLCLSCACLASACFMLVLCMRLACRLAYACDCVHVLCLVGACHWLLHASCLFGTCGWLFLLVLRWLGHALEWALMCAFVQSLSAFGGMRSSGSYHSTHKNIFHAQKYKHTHTKLYLHLTHQHGARVGTCTMLNA